MLAAMIAAHGAVARADDGELRLCTDRGGLLATESPDGALHGVLHAWTVRGTREALELLDADGDVVWQGPLDALEPGPAAIVDPEAVARRFEALVPGLQARGDAVHGLGFHGRVDADGALRGAWRDGAVVVYALGLGEDGIFGGRAPGDAPLVDIPGARSPATSTDPLTGGRPASPAAALGRVVTARLEQADLLAGCALGGPDRIWVGAWPEPLALASGHEVTWASADAVLVRGPGGATLLEVVTGPQGARLQTSTIPLAPLPDAGPSTAAPIHAPGREMAAQLGARRAAAGLDPLAWDDALAWSALSQCAYLDWAARAGLDDGPLRQDPSSPLYVGEWPADRGGGTAVAERSAAEPWAVIDAWLEDPQRRGALLDPRATRVGACATPGGGRALEVGIDPSRPALARTVPAEGSAEVAVGAPLSAWFETPTARVISTRLEAGGQPVAHAVVTSAGPGGGASAVHLVPSAPYAADTVYRWEVAYEIDGEPRVIRRRFRTEAAAAAAAPPVAP